MARMGLDLNRISDVFLDGVPADRARPIYGIFEAVVHKYFRNEHFKNLGRSGERGR